MQKNRGESLIANEAPTTTVRFPRSLHLDAKHAAVNARMSLQGYLEQSVRNQIQHDAAPKKERPNVKTAMEASVAALDQRGRIVVSEVLEFLVAAPDFQIDALSKHLRALTAAYRGLGVFSAKR